MVRLRSAQEDTCRLLPAAGLARSDRAQAAGPHFRYVPLAFARPGESRSQPASKPSTSRGARRQTGRISGALLLGLLVAQAAWNSHSADPETTLANGTLSIRFGAANDVVRFTTGPDSTLLLQTDPTDLFAPGMPVLYQGQPILLKNVKKWILDLGGGDDKLIEPTARMADFWVYGGEGNDRIKIPLGPGVTHAYGGPGDDLINAEHGQHNFLYGQEGNDTLSGSSDGANYLDGGPGTNRLYVFRHTLQPPLGQKNTLIHNQGASDIFVDQKGDNIYRFLGTGTSAASGSVLLMDNGGFDVLDFTAWNHPVTLDTAKTSAQIVSVGAGASPLLTLTLAFGGIEQVLRPSNQAPIASDRAWVTEEDRPLAVALSASDADGDALTYTVVSGPLHGTLSGTAPALTYTPKPDWNGQDTFSFKAQDGKADSNTALVGVTVTPVNDAPLPVSTPTATPNPAEVGQTVAFLALAEDVDGDPLTYAWSFGDGSSGAGASAQHAYSSSGIFTPRVTVSDGKGGLSSGSTWLEVRAVDSEGPKIALTSVLLHGTLSDPAGVVSFTVNGEAVPLVGDGTWQKAVSLTGTTATATLSAIDGKGNVTTRTVVVSH